jgi:membrane protease YdiL (CAAX protease family)
LEDQQIPENLCGNCQNHVPIGNKFCSICGRAQNYEEVVIHSRKWPNIQQVGLFFIIEILCCIVPLITKENSLTTLYCIDAIMGISAILFFFNSWSENKTILKWPGFSVWKLLSLIVATILASITVTFVVDHLNELVFNKDMQYYSIFAFHKYGTYLMFASIALYPAIFEELAYRGYLMQKLLSVVDEKEAIYISSMLFFIIHFSLISIFWLLPFALFLGWLRIKTKTLWYGVLVHFFFNLTACFLDLHPLSDLLNF